MPALKWLRLLLNHTPDKYELLVRYYGYYSNRARGARKQVEQERGATFRLAAGSDNAIEFSILHGLKNESRKRKKSAAIQTAPCHQAPFLLQ